MFRVALITMLLIWSGVALATQDLGVYRVTCASEIGVFRLETFAIAPKQFDEQARAKVAKKGVFGALVPQECDLEGRNVVYGTGSDKKDEYYLTVTVDGDLLFKTSFALELDSGDRVEPNHVFHVTPTHAQHCWYTDSIARYVRERSYRHEVADLSSCVSKYWNNGSYSG